jgi:hypothetical protein
MAAWISVDDRLPELDDDNLMRRSKECLVSAEHGQHIAFIVHIGEGDARQGFEEDFAHWQIKGRDGYHLYQVTHWQELPPDPTPV